MNSRTVFNKPMMKKAIDSGNNTGLNSRVASSSGFQVPMITGMSNPASNDNDQF